MVFFCFFFFVKNWNSIIINQVSTCITIGICEKGSGFHLLSVKIETTWSHNLMPSWFFWWFLVFNGGLMVAAWVASGQLGLAEFSYSLLPFSSRVKTKVKLSNQKSLNIIRVSQENSTAVACTDTALWSNFAIHPEMILGYQISVAHQVIGCTSNCSLGRISRN